MRTGIRRLTEWIEDIQEDQKSPIFEEPIDAQEWADRIMRDINLGIIAPEAEE